MRQWLRVFGLVAATAGASVMLGATLAGATPDDVHTREQLASLRLPFIANEGQVAAPVSYYAPTFAGTLFVTQQGELVYSLPAPTTTASRAGWTLTETPRGRRGRPVGQEPSVTGVSYFLGDDPARWRSHVANYDQLGLGEVWPGVALSLRARGRSIEKIFTVRPGASTARIRMRVSGAHALAVDSTGALVARTGFGPVTFTAPVAYQERDGVRRPISVAYRLAGREYGFTVGAYDPKLPLVIDPLLQSTYLGGGAGDAAFKVAIHPTTGDVYVACGTSSSNFPGTIGGAQAANAGGIGDACVARLNRPLTALIQATYLGGGGFDRGYAIAIHPTNGNVYVAGETDSQNFPRGGIGVAAPGAAQPTFGGGSSDAFVARLSGTLITLLGSTYLGGSSTDNALALAIHPTTGDVYVTGLTSSTDFPHTIGGAQPAIGAGGLPDGYVARLTSDLIVLTQATYLGGNSLDQPSALAIHPATGNIYVAGGTFSTDFPGTAGGAQSANAGSSDAFVAELNSALTSVLRSTYLGGGDHDTAGAIAIHPMTGDVYVAGATASTNFPRVFGAAQPSFGGGNFDTFVARLNNTLTAVFQATYLGGGDQDTVGALAIHPTTGDVYVVGATRSTNFPGTSGGAQAANAGGFGDAFAARLNPSLTTLAQATYLGGSGEDVGLGLAIHPATGDVYVVGSTSSGNLPGTGGGAQPAVGGNGDGFLARLTFGLAAVDGLGLSAIVNLPSFAVGQTLNAGGGVINPGLPFVTDFYVGLLRPDNSIEFVTQGGTVVGNLGSLQSFKPIVMGASLAAPFSVTVPTYYTHAWAGGELHGNYLFFALAVKAGVIAGGSVTQSDILGFASAPFAFP